MKFPLGREPMLDWPHLFAGRFRNSSVRWVGVAHMDCAPTTHEVWSLRCLPAIRIGIVLGSALVLMLACPLRCARAQEPIAKVPDMRGNWYLSVGENPEEKVVQWERLPLGGEIRIKTPTSQDYIVVTDIEGKILEERRCNDISACNRPIFLPRVGKENSISAAVRTLSKVWQRLWSDPDRYSMHRQKDIFDNGDARLSEGVVSLRDKGRIGLSTVTQNFTKGRYYLYLQRNPGEQASDEPIGPIVLDWDPGAPSTVLIQGLKPGVYEVGMLSRKGAEQAFKESGPEAWILLCSAKDYSDAAASFQRAVSVTKNWGQTVSPERSRAFLRADLTELAETHCNAPK